MRTFAPYGPTSSNFAPSGPALFSFLGGGWGADYVQGGAHSVLSTFHFISASCERGGWVGLMTFGVEPIQICQISRSFHNLGSVRGRLFAHDGGA